MTPSPLNRIGVKGMGEGAAIGAPPAVIAAVLDALHPLVASDHTVPVTPETIWRAIRAARPA